MDYNALGKRIRQQRKQRKWTQENLAERAGISVSFLGHIERGSRKASVETLVSLSNSLQIGTDYLLSDSLDLNEDYDTNSKLRNWQKSLLKGFARVMAEESEEYDLSPELNKKG